jgi:hypothetical protein
MILLDFFSGSHGHFLEYVINTWLFKGPRVANIFTDLGTSHLIRKNTSYLQHRIIESGHYSEFNYDQGTPDKVIRISINDSWANWIYQINVLSRAGDIPLEKKLSLTPLSVRLNPSKLRNEWYAKFNLVENGYSVPGNWRWQDISSFDFPMESLFDPIDFYHELYKLSNFLETTFVPDIELSNLLHEFLNKNQGWTHYKDCKNIIRAVFSGNNVEFSSNEILQALINSSLTESIGMFDGDLFDCCEYPTSTSQIWQLIEKHLHTFDSKF